MDLSASEFADEYQDWLAGQPGAGRAPWFDMPVARLEHGALHRLGPDASVGTAIAIMNQNDCGALVVVEGERLLGIFTARDVLSRVLARGLDLDRARVASVMTRAPEVLTEDTSLAQALRAMARSRYLHLPLVDACGRPLAMVSMQRILEFVCETFPKEILNAPPEQVSGTFALEGG
jgi:predicted transcriptional regulator